MELTSRRDKQRVGGLRSSSARLPEDTCAQSQASIASVGKRGDGPRAEKASCVDGEAGDADLHGAWGIRRMINAMRRQTATARRKRKNSAPMNFLVSGRVLFARNITEKEEFFGSPREMLGSPAVTELS